MNKLAIRETFPPGIVGREIVLAQMCHHYRRITTAKARVNTNLFKPPKISLSRPLSAEVASIVQRSLSPRSPPKHRRCLKYEQDFGEQHFKPSPRSQAAESKLRSTPEVYHPAVKTPKTHQEPEGFQRATQTSLENSLVEDLDPKTKDEAVQTSSQCFYKPIDHRSVQFLRDITTDALQQKAFTSSALNRIFLEHQFRNIYSLSQELMERELEELRRQLGMLPRHRPNSTIVSDEEALDALDTLVLDPQIKEQVIRSLRLSRDNVAKKPSFKYFDRLKDEDYAEYIPTRETLQYSNGENFVEPQTKAEELLEQTVNILRTEEESQAESLPSRGWNAEVTDDATEGTSSTIQDDETDDKDEESDGNDSTTNDEKIPSDESDTGDEVETESDDEDVTQKESTSIKQIQQPELVEIQSVASDLEQNKPTGDAASHLIGAEVIGDFVQEEKTQTTQNRTENNGLKSDKWRSSLEVVKEETDSTTGQISDISSVSTPTEAEIDRGTPLLSKRKEEISASQPSDTYYSVVNSKNVDDDVAAAVIAKETTESSKQNVEGSEKSKAGEPLEIVASSSNTDVTYGSLGQIVKNMSDLSESVGDKYQDDEFQDEDVDETGSRASEDDKDEGSDSDMSSIHTE